MAALHIPTSTHNLVGGCLALLGKRQRGCEPVCQYKLMKKSKADLEAENGHLKALLRKDDNNLCENIR